MLLYGKSISIIGLDIRNGLIREFNEEVLIFKFWNIEMNKIID